MATSVLTLLFNQKGARRTTRSVLGLSAALLGAGLVAKRAATYLIEAADAYTNLQNRTRVFASSQKDANVRMAGTIRISRKMNATIEETGGIMQRISIAQKTAGFSTKELMQITENLTQASLLSGATTQESEGALRQFAQGMAANRLAGQELNSVLEQTPLVAVMLAKGLTKMGKHGVVAAGDLRRLGEAGELTTKVLVDVFGKALPELEEMMRKFQFPIERLFTSLKRETSLFAGQVLELSGASDSFRGMLNTVIDKFSEWNDLIREGGPARDEFIGQLRKIAYIIAGPLVIVALGSLGLALAAVAGFLLGPGGLVIGVGMLGGAIYEMKDDLIEVGGYTVTLSTVLEGLWDTVFKSEDTEDSWISDLGSDTLKFAVWAYRSIGDSLQRAYMNMALWNNEKKLGHLLDIQKTAQEGGHRGATARRKITSAGGAEGIHEAILELMAERKRLLATSELIPKTWEESQDALRAEIEGAGGIMEHLSNSSKEVMSGVSAAIATAIGEGALKAAAELTKLQEKMKAQNEAKKAELAKALADADQLKEDEAERGRLRDAEAKALQEQKDRTLAAREEYDKLRSSYDKTYQAQLKLAEGTEILKTAFEEDAITFEMAQAGIDHLQASYDALLSEEMFSKLEGMQALTAGAQQGIKSMIDELGSPAEIMAGGFQDAISTTSDAITDFVTTGKLDFKEFGRSIIKIITQMIVQMLVLKALQAALGMFPGAAPSPSVASGPTGLSAMAGLGGNMNMAAMGGPVTTGQPVMVGEKGPELFVPPSGGSIVNNRELGMARPQVNVSVINVDDPSSVPRAMSSDEGEEVVMNIISRNSDALREIA